MTESQAKKLGFNSVSEYESYEISEKRMYENQFRPGGLDGTDFEFIKRELSTETGHSGSTIMNLVGTKPNQQKMVIGCIGDNRITKITHQEWLYLFRQWILRNKSNKALISQHTTNPNQDVAAIAKEALNEE